MSVCEFGAETGYTIETENEPRDVVWEWGCRGGWLGCEGMVRADARTCFRWGMFIISITFARRRSSRIVHD